MSEGERWKGIHQPSCISFRHHQDTGLLWTCCTRVTFVAWGQTIRAWEGTTDTPQGSIEDGILLCLLLLHALSPHKALQCSSFHGLGEERNTDKVSLKQTPCHCCQCFLAQGCYYLLWLLCVRELQLLTTEHSLSPLFLHKELCSDTGKFANSRTTRLGRA